MFDLRSCSADHSLTSPWLNVAGCPGLIFMTEGINPLRVLGHVGWFSVVRAVYDVVIQFFVRVLWKSLQGLQALQGLRVDRPKKFLLTHLWRGRFQSFPARLLDATPPMFAISAGEADSRDRWCGFFLKKVGGLRLAQRKTAALEAPPGFEPGVEVLQTSALPLGDGADRTEGRDFGPTGPRYSGQQRMVCSIRLGTRERSRPSRLADGGQLRRDP